MTKWAASCGPCRRCGSADEPGPIGLGGRGGGAARAFGCEAEGAVGVAGSASAPGASTLVVVEAKTKEALDPHTLVLWGEDGRAVQLGNVAFP
jgi:hypothetical protein